MSEWREARLGEVCSRLRSGTNITAKEIHEAGEVPVFGGNGIRGYTSEPNFSGECAIVGRQGAYCGNVRYFSGSARMSEHAVVAVAGAGNNTRFLAYLLSTMNLGRLSGQAAQPGLSVKVLAQEPVRLPPLGLQVRVASFVGSIDDLVENNRRRLEVLDEMARAIYREWFVKFRYPGHEVVPMVDSALGPIPKGWIARPFSEVVDFHIGGGWGTTQEDHGSEQPGHVIRGTDIPRVAKSDVSTVPFRFHRESNLRSRQLEHGDIVFEVSGGSKGQPVGRSLLIQQSILDLFDAPVICASFCKLIRAKSTLVEPSILIHLLQDAYSAGQLDAYQVQSTGITNFKWKPFLEHFKVVLPPKRQQEEMVQIFDQLNELGVNIGRKIQVLVQIRDKLLPKLVKGEIDVSTLDLDALVGAGLTDEGAVA